MSAGNEQRIPLTAGLHAEVHATVGHADTAHALGSGELPVLGTPRLLALLEAATVAAVSEVLGPGVTTVGSQVLLRHRRPSPVGSAITVRAELTEVNGARLVFRATATDQDGTMVGSGTIERVVVDAATFAS